MVLHRLDFILFHPVDTLDVSGGQDKEVLIYSDENCPGK